MVKGKGRGQRAKGRRQKAEGRGTNTNTSSYPSGSRPKDVYALHPSHFILFPSLN